MTMWLKEKRHIATYSTKLNELETLATKTLEGNQTTSSFCLTWGALSRILSKWNSDAMASSSPGLGSVESSIPSIRF